MAPPNRRSKRLSNTPSTNPTSEDEEDALDNPETRRAPLSNQNGAIGGDVTAAPNPFATLELYQNLDTSICAPQDPQTLSDPRDREILELRQRIETIRRRAESGRSLSRAALRRVQEGSDKKDSTITKLRTTIDNEQARARRIELDCLSKLSAAEIEYRARLDSAREASQDHIMQQQLEILKDANKKLKSDDRESQRDMNRLIKNNASLTGKVERLHDEIETITRQHRHEKEDNKALNKKVKDLTKKLDGQLEMKLKASTKKAELSVEKERLALEKVRETRRKSLENIEKQHQHKKDLVNEKKRAAIDVSVAREEHKSKKQKRGVDQSAERINTAHMLHAATNGRFAGPNAAARPDGSGSASGDIASMIQMLGDARRLAAAEAASQPQAATSAPRLQQQTLTQMEHIFPPPPPVPVVPAVVPSVAIPPPPLPTTVGNGQWTMLHDGLSGKIAYVNVATGAFTLVRPPELTPLNPGGSSPPVAAVTPDAATSAPGPPIVFSSLQFTDGTSSQPVELFSDVEDQGDIETDSSSEQQETPPPQTEHTVTTAMLDALTTQEPPPESEITLPELDHSKEERGPSPNLLEDTDE